MIKHAMTIMGTPVASELLPAKIRQHAYIPVTVVVDTKTLEPTVETCVVKFEILDSDNKVKDTLALLLAPVDKDALNVYADWLHEQGFEEAAERLRRQFT